MGGFMLLLMVQIFGVQTEDDSIIDEKLLDNLIKGVMGCYPNTAAFAISAVKDGKVVVNKSFGKANREKDIDVTKNTRFTIGSISKGFTSYMAGKQVLEGLYGWKDKISEVFAKKNVKMSLQGDFRNNHCTIEDALIHRTGVKTYPWLLSDGRNISRAQWVTDYLPQFEEQLEMRSGFYYNNWFYTMVGYLVELFGGKSFEKLVKETIFEPLGMSQTMFVSDEEYDELGEEEFSQPYKENSGENGLYPVPKHAMKYISIHNPAGGIVSTVGDMAKYMIGIIDAVNGKQDSVLNSEVMKQITQPMIYMTGFNSFLNRPTFPVSFKDCVYGYGHMLGSYRGYDYIHHGGATFGHFSYITTIPSLNMGVFSVISGDDYLYKDIRNMQMLMQLYLFDMMMGIEEPWIDQDGACSFPDKWKQSSRTFPAPEQAAPERSTETDPKVIEYRSLDTERPERDLSLPAEVERYLGQYTNPVFPPLVLKLEESILKFEMGQSNGTVSIKPDGRMEILLNRPTDPLDLPEADKTKAYLHFVLASDVTNQKMESVEFEYVERYKFHRSSALNLSSSFVVILGTVFLTLRDRYSAIDTMYVLLRN